MLKLGTATLYGEILTPAEVHKGKILHSKRVRSFWLERHQPSF